MRIVLVSTDPTTSEPCEMAGALRARGHHVDVQQHPAVTVSDAPVLGHRLGDLWEPAPPGVVLAHDWVAGLAAQVASRDVGVPVVQCAHVLTDPTVDAEQARLEAALARSASLVAVPSAGEGERLVAGGVARDRLRVVPHGVDTARFTDDGPAWPRGETKHRIVVADDLDDPSYVGAVVEALPTLPETRLLVVGTADPKDPRRQETARALVTMAASRRVTDRIELLGPVDDDLPGLLRSVDLVVIPAGPHTRFALRAMACGRPVVGAAVGGLADAVTDGVTGLLLEGRPPAQLGDALRGLLGDELRRESLGLAATDRARVRYRWEVVAEAMERAAQEARPEDAATAGAVS